MLTRKNVYDRIYYEKHRNEINRKKRLKRKIERQKKLSEMKIGKESKLNGTNVKVQNISAINQKKEIRGGVDPKSPILSYKSGKSICMMQPNDASDPQIIHVKDEDDENSGLRRIECDNAQFYQIRNMKNKRDCLYICGQNQSGKSTYVARYLKLFCTGFPEIPVYLFTKLEDDPIFKDFDINKINIDEYDFDADNALNDFENSLVIFDDVDQIHDDDIRKKMYKMIDEIFCNGAHKNINIIVTNHLLTEYRKTRTMLNECSSITIFPKSGNALQLNNLLRNYVGFGRKIIKEIRNLPSRWVTIFKNYPHIILYENGIYLPY